MSNEENIKEVDAVWKVANELTMSVPKNEEWIKYAGGNTIWVVRGVLLGAFQAVKFMCNQNKAEAFWFINQTLQGYFDVEEV